MAKDYTGNVGGRKNHYEGNKASQKAKVVYGNITEGSLFMMVDHKRKHDNQWHNKTDVRAAFMGIHHSNEWLGS